MSIVNQYVSNNKRRNTVGSYSRSNITQLLSLAIRRLLIPFVYSEHLQLYFSLTENSFGVDGIDKKGKRVYVLIVHDMKISNIRFSNMAMFPY